MAALQVGQEFPQLELPTLGGEPQQVALGCAAGCVYVVGHSDCWTTRLMLPFAARLSQRARSGVGVRVVLQDDPEAAASLLAELGMDVSPLLDPAPYRLGERLGLESVPTLFQVSGDGKVQRVVEGFERAALEQIAAGLELEGPLFGPDEDVPELRPG